MRLAQLLARSVAGVAGLVLLALGPWAACYAGQFNYCDPPSELDARQQDTVLRFAAVVKSTLDSSSTRVALIARSGIDLSRFDMRYSHAGISLRAHPNGPWSVRQLYFDCDERRPRIFDQGIAGFLVGSGDPSIGYLSVVLLPDSSNDLERITLDNRRALGLLGASYSANAYAFAQRYQNCNQWVAEMLAVAWGQLSDSAQLRVQAQSWLADAGYQPARFEVGNPVLMWLGGVLPWLHRDDHPQDDLSQWRFRVSMPESIESFARARAAGARRIEFCHADRRIVIREGWEPIAAGCKPGEADRVIEMDS
jgi:hypothetical protein